MICIIIGGASASGKTFLSEELLKELRTNSISSQLINMDNYFHERPENIDPDLFRKITNFDTPSMLHLPQLSQDLMTLNSGQPFYQKAFEFKTNRYKKNELDEYVLEKIDPSDVIIIEGIFAQYFANNYLPRELATISINVANSNYMDIIKTRIQRDTAPAPFGRGLNQEQVLINEHTFVGPGFYQYTAKNVPGSDIYVLNDHDNGDEKQISFATIIQQIMEALSEKQTAIAHNKLQPRQKAPNAMQLALKSHQDNERITRTAELESEAIKYLSTHTLIKQTVKLNTNIQQTIQNRIERSRNIGSFFKSSLVDGHQCEATNISLDI